MHTPDQARELWCPMVRFADSSNVDHGKRQMCIAEECAMWRWMPGDGYHNELRIEPLPGGGGRKVTERVPNAPTHGYCGLSGRPGAAV